MPPRIERLAADFLDHPVRITVLRLHVVLKLPLTISVQICGLGCFHPGWYSQGGAKFMRWVFSLKFVFEGRDSVGQKMGFGQCQHPARKSTTHL